MRSKPPPRELFCWRSYDPDETCTTNYNDEGIAAKPKALLEENTNVPQKNRTNDIPPEVWAAAKRRAVRRVRKLKGVVKPECSREEAIKRWVEKLKIGMEDKAFTRRVSQQSLEYYNEKNFTNFVLVHPRISNMVDMYNGRAFIHVNFTAKKPNDDDGDAVLFFAELAHGHPCSVTSCIILDSSIEVQKFC